MASMPSLHAGAHAVHFYQGDADLAAVVANQIAGAISSAEPVIVIAEAAHREVFAAGLAARGVQLRAAQARGLLTWRDAREVTGRLLVGGSIDPAAFAADVESLVRGVAASRGVVHVYGEIVAVLWAAGEVVAAMELERLWNELMRSTAMSLLCGYSAQLMTEAESLADYLEVRAEHGQVIAAAPAAHDAEVTRRFPAAPGSARHARWFVAETLRVWQCLEIVEQAELIVSELVTNAIRHARSEVAVSLTRRNEALEVGVGDRALSPPRPGKPGLGDAHGRGLLLVSALSSRWGHRPLPEGKLVWAEILRHRG